MKNNLLIIFIRNPKLGKVKTRLAATIGDHHALEIYKILLKHTFDITKNLSVIKQIHYLENISADDYWDSLHFDKKLQFGKDLGKRMKYAFQQGFIDGFENIIIIGSDMHDLSQKDIDDAFVALKNNDIVLGPSKDGGYYLLGMKKMKLNIFQNKKWGTETVFEDTMNNMKNEKVSLLAVKNDIDIFEDIEGIEIFQKFISK